MSELRLLGAVDLRHGDESVQVGPPQRRAVLAALAVDAGRPVTLETLVDRVWDEPPDGALRAMYVHIARLRQTLEPIVADGSPVRIVRRSGGYILDVGADWVDVHRFRSLLARATNAPADPAVPLGWLREALGLWRGVPLTGVPGDWAARTRDEWQRKRVDAVVHWATLELELNNVDSAIDGLQAELAERPMVEPLVAGLMRALHAAGRGTEALRLFATVRQQLIDELGAEPSSMLREVHRRILSADHQPSGRVTVSAAATAGDDSTVEARDDAAAAAPLRQLPPEVYGFTGRTTELATLDRWLDEAHSGSASVTVMAITGTGGVGKTALAVMWAGRARHRLPDGELYANLRGYASSAPRRPIDVLTGFLRALGVPAQEVPSDVDEAAARFRSLLADRRMLVVLDNAATVEQVQPLLPGGAGTVVLVTSRDRLSGLVAEHGARRLTVDVLAEADAVDLLGATLGADRVKAEPGAAAELAHLCGYLPLALRVAAANVLNRRRASIADCVTELRTGNRLDALGFDGRDSSPVTRAFDLSYGTLGAPEQRMFRWLGLLPGLDIDVPAAAALLGEDSARSRLDSLAAAHLIEEVAPGRYGLHDLLRLYARHRLLDDPQADREAAFERLLGHYGSRLRTAATRLYAQMPLPPPVDTRATADDDLLNGEAGQRQARAWLDLEAANVVAAVRHCSDHGPFEYGWRLGYAMRGYFDLCRDIPAWESVGLATLAAAERTADPTAIAAAEHNLAHLDWCRSRHESAIVRLDRALTLARQGNWTAGECSMLASLGVLRLDAGRLDLAERDLLAAGELAARMNYTAPEANSLANLGEIYLRGGQPVRAMESYRSAILANRRVPSDSGVAHALTGQASAARMLGQYERSEELLNEALATYAQVGGHRAGEVAVGCAFAALHLDRNEVQRAADQAAAALQLARDTSDPYAEAAALILAGTADLRLGRRAEAARQHREASELARRLNFPYLEAQAMVGLAQVALADGDKATAAHAAGRARTMARDCGFWLVVADANTVLAGAALPQIAPIMN